MPPVDWIWPGKDTPPLGEVVLARVAGWGRGGAQGRGVGRIARI
jgi:hypothetical protein